MELLNLYADKSIDEIQITGHVYVKNKKSPASGHKAISYKTGKIINVLLNIILNRKYNLKKLICRVPTACGKLFSRTFPGLLKDIFYHFPG